MVFLGQGFADGRRHLAFLPAPWPQIPAREKALGSDMDIYGHALAEIALTGLHFVQQGRAAGDFSGARQCTQFEPLIITQKGHDLKLDRPSNFVNDCLNRHFVYFVGK